MKHYIAWLCGYATDVSLFPLNYLAVLPAIRVQQGLSAIALLTYLQRKAIITRKPPPENDRRRE
jgi:hypothetical protein